MRSKKFLSVILSVVLVVGLMPFPASATQTDADDSGTWVTVEGTPGVDYVDGEVLVAVRGGQEALSANTPQNALQAIGLGGPSYSVVESLTTVSDSDIAQAADDAGASDAVNLDNTSNSTASDGTYSLQSVSDDSIEIVLLSCDDVEQTINDLLKLDCVVTAQPNYIYSLTDDETADSSAVAAAEAVESAISSDTLTDGESSTNSTLTATEPVESSLSSDSFELASTTASTTSTMSELTTTSGGTSEPFYAGQWSLESRENLTNSGYPSTTINLDVEDAWTAGAGNEDNGDVVVAVIDCGVDYTHEDLVDNMWTGGEASWSTALGGGKYGYNALEGGTARNDPMDRNGHGTHCASTIAATWNNTGIAGINNKVKIMAVKIVPNFSDEKSTSANAILGFNYVIAAKENGVNVVATNNSYGAKVSVGYPDLLQTSMIYQAGEKGIVSVYASNNYTRDNDLVPLQQLANSNPYLITVGAMNSVGTAAQFSEWGERSVDVYAPGTRVLAATTTYSSKNDTKLGMVGAYTPWLKDSASSKSAYFVDDSGTTSRTDGITYDLVKCNMGADESGALVPTSIEESLAKPTCESPGYYNGDTNNDRSYRFSLSSAASLTDTQRLAVRVTIPSETWKSYKSKNQGDNLYIGALANVVGYGTDIYPLLIPFTHESTGWTYSDESLMSPRDGTWYNTSYRQSLSALDAGKEANGDVTLLFVLSTTTFNTSNSIYLDNLSLGWAASSGFGTQNANGTYYYSDGTSMATPNTTGVVSLLSSHAKVKSKDTNNQQSAETAKEIVSFIKGGVTSVDSLGDQCKTGGVVDAQVSYATYVEYQKASEPEGKLSATSALKPVPESITDNGDGTCTLSGSFFGSSGNAVEITFNDSALTVTNWSDSSITFKSLSYDKETIGKVVVKKKNGDDTVSGQSYLVMPATAGSTATFSNLSNPDFEITYTETGADGQVTTFTTNASEVTPLKMAAALGYVYVYGVAASSCVPVLMRYNIASKTWDTKNYLDGYSSQIATNSTGSRLSDSMVAGKSEIYLKATSKQNAYDSILFTIQAETGAISSSVTIEKTQSNSAGFLGFYDGKLFLIGGKKGEPLCSAIYPDTAQVCWSASETLPVNTYYGYATNNGSGLSITGSFNSDLGDYGAASGYGYEPGQRNQEMDITFNADGSTTLKTSSSVFFPEADKSSEYGLDSGQGFSTIAAAGVDGGVLMTGPVKKNETAEMVDTWHYTTSNQKWSEITATRFAPALEASACASTYDGIYYVMAQDAQGSNVFQKFGSYSLSALGLSDSNVTPTSDALKSSSVGDANNNNKINVVDAQIVYDMSNDIWTTTTKYDKLIAVLKEQGTNWDAITLSCVADANGDKVVNAIDARAIQNYVHTGKFVEAA